MRFTQGGRLVRFLLALVFLSWQQMTVTDARITMLPFGITTVGKTFRIQCTVTDENFKGWFDINGDEVTARPNPDELVRDKFYVEQSRNTYTLVIQNVVVADGGNYTCKGDTTEKKFTVYVEFYVTQFPDDQSVTVGKSQTVLCSAKGYPVPTFKWYKKFKLIKFNQDPRFTLLSNGSMVINPVKETDTADYICRITQLGDAQQEGTSLREQMKNIKVTAYGPPRINTEESTKPSELYSYVGNPSKVTIKCIWWGYPNPTLTIRKNNVELPSSDVTVKAPTEGKFLSYLTATVMTDGNEDFGQYICGASNRLGSASHTVDINKAGPPSAPQNITFSTTCDHLTVTWTPPDSDGGLPLTRYAVEINDTKKWSDTVHVGVTTNRFTFTSVEGVKPRTLYTVVVQAFNQLKTGKKGQGSVTSAYCPPSGSYNITNTVTWLNSTSFMLKWTRPPLDGGDPDLTYDIEYSKETPDGKYVHWNSRKKITTQEYNVSGLEGGSKYEFRVFVSNIAGRKLEPAIKEFNVYSGVGVKPTSPPIAPIGQQLVYDMSVNCTSFYMQVDFSLKSSYLDTETFRFENSSCGSHTATSEHVSLKTPLDACGTTSRDSGDSVTYVNKVIAETTDKETIFTVEFPFSCTYRNRETIGVPSFQPRKKVTYFQEGYGNFSFEMGLYRSSEYASAYDVSEYPVNVDPFGHLYCETKLDTSDSGLVLLADTCLATPSMDPTHSVQYTFIDDGCPVDNGTKYDHTMSSTQRFQLAPFRWIPKNYTLVYLHCNVIVCQKNGNSRCSMGCSPDRRRARSTGKEETLRVTLGPIMLGKPQHSSSDIQNGEPLPHTDTPSSSTMPTWMLILCICGAVVGLALILYGAAHLFVFLVSAPHNAPVPPVQRNSEELELFCSEPV